MDKKKIIAEKKRTLYLLNEINDYLDTLLKMTDEEIDLAVKKEGLTKQKWDFLMKSVRKEIKKQLKEKLS